LNLYWCLRMMMEKKNLSLSRPGRQRLFWVAMLALFILFALASAAGGRMFYELERERLLAAATLVDEAWLEGVLFKMTIAFLALLSLFALLILLVARSRADRFGKLVETQRNMVFSLANLAEIRDQDTGKHLERTRSYGVILAGELRKLPKYRRVIDDRFIADLYDAAPLHDIGKVGIPDQVLLKPGRLTAEEFTVMARHAEIGGRIIGRIIDKLSDPLPFLLMSRNIARYHHEKYNGQGYPEGLAGEAIPLEALIYALGDAYDAIRAKRPYKEPVTHPEAVQRIFAGRGSHFDPDVVNAFIDCEEQFMEMFESYQVYDDVYLGFTDAKSDSGPAVVWSSEFEVGVEMIDHQHRELIDRINKLLAAIREGRGREETFGLVRFLQEYVVEHFSAEERFMRRYHYPDYPAHKEMHDAFIEELNSLVAILEKEGIDSDMVVVVNQKVINWVVAHIFLVDKGLRRCLI